MATLKQLVDETTNIKDELVTCHSNLKNNLSAKGVECSATDKLSSLINKVNDIGIDMITQKGIVNIKGVTSTTVDISEVDLSKSICFTKFTPSSRLATYSNYTDTVCNFLNSSQINISSKSAFTGTASNELLIYWEVIEFRSGIRGVYNYSFSPSSVGYGTSDITHKIQHNFNIKNPDKCLIYYSYNFSNSSKITHTRVDIFDVTNETFSYFADCYTPYEVNVYIVELL